MAYFFKRSQLSKTRRGIVLIEIAVWIGSLAILMLAFMIAAHILTEQENRALIPKLRMALPPENKEWQMLTPSDANALSARYVLRKDMTNYVTVSYLVELGDYRSVYDIVQKMPSSAAADTKINPTNDLEYVKLSRAVYGEQNDPSKQNYLIIFVGTLPVILRAQGLSKERLMDFANSFLPYDQLVALDQMRLFPLALR